MSNYKYFLTCCLMIKNEGKYIEEWMDHYISEGVEHFYIIDNGSTDNTLELLKKYDDLITLFKDTRLYPNLQTTMLNDNFWPLVKESEWTMIVDADELIVGKYGKSIRQHLKEMAKNVSSVYVIWTMFYGKEESVDRMKDIKTRFNYDYLHELGMNSKYFLMFGKSIFRPDRLKIDRLHIHQQVIRDTIIDNFNRIHKSFPDTICQRCNHINEETLSKTPIQLNHYFIKTRIEYEDRMKSDIYDTIKNPRVGERYVPSGWDYLAFLKEVYNLGEKYVIKED